MIKNWERYWKFKVVWNGLKTAGMNFLICFGRRYYYKKMWQSAGKHGNIVGY
jgi:hypothetical protein